jgi:hypothetical protein
MVYTNYSLSFDDYDIYNKNDLQFSKLPEITNLTNCKQLDLFLLLNAKEDLIKEGLDINICLDNVNKLNFFPTHF